MTFIVVVLFVALGGWALGYLSTGALGIAWDHWQRERRGESPICVHGPKGGAT